MFLDVLFPTAYCLVGSMLANGAIMVPAWLCSCLAQFVIVIAVVDLNSGCSYCSVLVVGLVDFLSLFVSWAGASRVGILATSSTTLSTRSLSRKLQTPHPSHLSFVRIRVHVEDFVPPSPSSALLDEDGVCHGRFAG